jgi:tRNA dimethylallyltransferase
MISAGLLEEAERVAATHAPLSRTARKCIGYREVWEGRGRGDAEAAIIEAIQRNTRRFSRKQGTWFRRFPEIGWLEGDRNDAPRLAEAIARTVTAEGPSLPPS